MDLGRIKDHLLQCEALGVATPSLSKLVCADCVEDTELRALVTQYGASAQCSYCERITSVASFDVVIERIALCVSRYYTDPANELPYCGAEGGYLGPMYDTNEVLSDLGLDLDNSFLFDDIVASFDISEWAEVNWATLRPAERRRHGWERFKEATMHSRRYTFWSMQVDEEDPWHPDSLPAGRMLTEIQTVIESCQIIKRLAPGTPLWRVRKHDISDIPNTPKDFSAPPNSVATQANRMSPAGISMFYGAEDLKTAVEETLPARACRKRTASAACFRTMFELNVLDLVDLPALPSCFTEQPVPHREELRFLRIFAHEISKPVEDNEARSIKYVPTQAFTEHVRWQMKTGSGEPIDGICYRSSRTGRRSYVLFCDNQHCIAGEPGSRSGRWLDFDSATIKRDLRRARRKRTTSLA
ncbi:MAG: HEPN-associated N-terminal domain-containing protein [Myxococcota bacterium]